jgi:hypothetical protein
MVLGKAIKENSQFVSWRTLKFMIIECTRQMPQGGDPNNGSLLQSKPARSAILERCVTWVNYLNPSIPNATGNTRDSDDFRAKTTTFALAINRFFEAQSKCDKDAVNGLLKEYYDVARTQTTRGIAELLEKLAETVDISAARIYYGELWATTARELAKRWKQGNTIRYERAMAISDNFLEWLKNGDGDSEEEKEEVNKKDRKGLG